MYIVYVQGLSYLHWLSQLVRVVVIPEIHAIFPSVKISET